MAADPTVETYRIPTDRMHQLQDALADGRAALSAFATVEELLQQLPNQTQPVTLTSGQVYRLLHSLRVQADSHLVRCEALARLVPADAV